MAAHQSRRIPLQTQEQFEALLNPEESLSGPVLINFSATWCGPCRSLDWDFLLEEFPDLTVYKCDVDENSYTTGFCGVRSIPAFVFLFPSPKGQKSRVVGPETVSGTAKVATWISATLKANATAAKTS